MEHRTDYNQDTNNVLTEQPRKVYNDFRKFLATGNIVNFAVGILVGNALSSVIQAFISDIFDPVVSKITGKSVMLVDQKLVLGQGDIVISWGHFLSQVINFLVTAIAVYIVIRAMQKTIMKDDDGELDDSGVKKEILSELKLNNRLMKRSLELERREKNYRKMDEDLKRREDILSVYNRFDDDNKRV